ncbi:MAG: BamA/TamA family outer membrane protein [Tannerella sp.]|jgi:outer membrane protein assembly factor BamA|nr:BamA/TamA family outer membrane protein [Tannerella sp.]
MEERRIILSEAGLYKQVRIRGRHVPFMLCCALVYITAVTSCSTTKNLPSGGILYTGIAAIDITDKDSIKVDDDLLVVIENAFAYPPNNALLGSSSTRIPIPVGLWIYNANVNKKGQFHRWIVKKLAAKPVLISVVKPETRALIVRNILRDNGYFKSMVDYEIIPNKKDSLKAKIRYSVTLNEPYMIDSIEWRRMQHRGDTLLRLNETERFVNAGDLFSTDKLEAERQRIAAIMQNNGYYYFRPEYITYQADSTLSPQKIRLLAGLKRDAPRAVLRPWKIGDVSVRLRGYDNEPPTDSIYYKDLLIYYERKLRVRPDIMYNQLKFGKGELYSLAKQKATQTAINSLDIFRFTEFRYTPKNTLPTCDTMNVEINALYDYPLNGAFEIRTTSNDNGYVGPGASLNLTRRNTFGGGEVLTASVYGSYEWNTGTNNIKHTGVINNYEAGVKTSILFPRLLLPQIGKRAYNFSASTYLDFDANVLNRAKYYTMLKFGGSLSYEFLPSSIRQHVFTPLKLVFNKLQATTPAFNNIVTLNPSLSQSLQNQFIPSIGYSYTLDNSSVREERSKTWWRFTVSEAGNIISGTSALFGKNPNGPDSIFGNPYAQFLKATTELRYNYYIDRNQRLVMRIGGGIIYSYGNSGIAPYNERFYVGGANSIRAFTIRGIGPGRFRSNPENPYAYIDQNGDWKLEGNMEYRGRLVGNLDIAVFIDAGNVWLLRKDETRPGGTFQWKYFLNDIALGTGVGFRYDMDLFVFRMDIGYALHIPYDTRRLDKPDEQAAGNDTYYKGKKRYFNVPSFRDGIGFHIALGYPF